jgi:hypothetical protein
MLKRLMRQAPREIADARGGAGTRRERGAAEPWWMWLSGMPGAAGGPRAPIAERARAASGGGRP